MTLFFVFTIGCVVGSFLGLVIDRFPHDSVLSPRSHCDNCGQTLGIFDLIPILSQILSHFKCRYCDYHLPYWYSCLEGLTGILFILSWLNLLDLSTSLICLASLILVTYDLKIHAFPLMIWFIFFVIFWLTCPHKPLVIICILLAYLTEKTALQMGSGDWLYLSLIAFHLEPITFIRCLFFASLTAILFHVFKNDTKKAEIPFLPFLFMSYLFCIYLNN